jgi:hypothetical protein
MHHRVAAPVNAARVLNAEERASLKLIFQRRGRTMRPTNR